MFFKSDLIVWWKCKITLLTGALLAVQEVDKTWSKNCFRFLKWLSRDSVRCSSWNEMFMRTPSSFLSIRSASLVKPLTPCRVSWQQVSSCSNIPIWSSHSAAVVLLIVLTASSIASRARAVFLWGEFRRFHNLPTSKSGTAILTSFF